MPGGLRVRAQSPQCSANDPRCQIRTEGLVMYRALLQAMQVTPAVHRSTKREAKVGLRRGTKGWQQRLPVAECSWHEEGPDLQNRPKRCDVTWIIGCLPLAPCKISPEGNKGFPAPLSLGGGGSWQSPRGREAALSRTPSPSRSQVIRLTLCRAYKGGGRCVLCPGISPEE